jgi:hypothetical protein
MLLQRIRRHINQLPPPVKCAAVLGVDGWVYYMTRPARHHNIIRAMMVEHSMPAESQGFLLDSDEYVTRGEAKNSAVLNNQMLKSTSDKHLYTEDLW